MPEARVRLLLHALLVLAAISSTGLAARAQARQDSTAGREAAPFLAAKAPAFFDERQEQTTQQQPQGQTTTRQQGQTGRPAGKNDYDPSNPLTSGQKMRRSLRSAFLSPQGYFNNAFGATLTQLREEDLPHKDTGDKAADWASRFARNFSTRATRRIFSDGIYASLFRQDPRYEPSKSKGIGRRALHAASRVVVTRDDDGNLEPNYSRLAGNITGSALANLWEHSTPGRDRIGADATLRRFGRSLAFDVLGTVVFKEFWPDLMRAIRR